MKITKVIASDFGCLSGSYSLFHDRPNVVVEENERGKSTLVAAILAGLYGFPPSRERKRLPEEEAYRPWSGGPYRVGLEIEDDDGRHLLVEREFGEKKEVTTVTDLSTNKDLTPEYVAGKDVLEIGERLLGISREVFVKTCLVRQLEIESVGDSSELVSKVQQIFDTSAGKGTAAGAISVLEGALRKYPGTQLKGPGLVETEVSRLRDAIAEKEARIRELIAERERVAPGMVRLRHLRNRLETLFVRRQQLEYLARKAENAEIESELREDERNRGELLKLIKQKESLKPYGNFPKEKASDFARLAGRLDELGKQRTQLTESLDKLKKDLEETKTRGKEYEGLEGLGEDFKTRLHVLSNELSRLGDEAEKKWQRLSEFEESLRRDHYDLSEIEDLSRRFSELNVEDNDRLRNSESRIPEIKARILELKEAEQECRRKQKEAKTPVRVLAAVAGLVLIAGVAGMALGATPTGAVVAAAGVAAIVFALFLAWHKAKSLREVKGQEEEATRQRQSLESERDALSQTLEDMAAKVGYAAAAELAEAFKRWGRLQDRAMRLFSLRKEAEAAEESVASYKEKTSGEIKRMGIDIPPTGIDLGVIRDAGKRLREYLDLTSSLREKEEHCRRTDGEIQQLDRDRERLQEGVRDVLKEARLPQDLPPEEATAKVEDVRQKSEEYHRLVTVWIPDKEQRLLSSKTYNEKKQRLESLRREITKRIAEKHDLANLEVSKPHSQYEEEARAIAREINENSEEKGKISREVLNVEDRYREEYPRLANEIADLKRTLERTERFQKSVSVALETLQRISAQSHALWAGALNARANEILRHLNPRCRELKFDENLHFTVVPAEGARPMDATHIEAQQSIGARHQIYLAVRLALSDYLSAAGKKLPVILDDPFATSDDDRFLSGMAFLCRDVPGAEHQFIVLTCHRRRHTDFLREKAPDLLDAIRIVRLTPPV
jgi:hypothetical protein